MSAGKSDDFEMAITTLTVVIVVVVIVEFVVVDLIFGVDKFLQPSNEIID